MSIFSVNIEGYINAASKLFIYILCLILEN